MESSCLGSPPAEAPAVAPVGPSATPAHLLVAQPPRATHGPVPLQLFSKKPASVRPLAPQLRTGLEAIATAQGELLHGRAQTLPASLPPAARLLLLRRGQMPARQPHHDAAWLAAENGILQPAVGPSAERRAAAKVAALNRASLSGRPFRRDSSKSSVAAAIAADASAAYAAGEWQPVLPSFTSLMHRRCYMRRFWVPQ